MGKKVAPTHTKNAKGVDRDKINKVQWYSGGYFGNFGTKNIKLVK